MGFGVQSARIMKIAKGIKMIVIELSILDYNYLIASLPGSTETILETH